LQGHEPVGTFLDVQGRPRQVIQRQSVAEVFMDLVQNIQCRNFPEIKRSVSAQDLIVKTANVEADHHIQTSEMFNQVRNLVF